DIEPSARQVDGSAMRQMAARLEVETKDRVTGRQQREEYRLIGLASRVRLHIRISAAEKLVQALYCEVFDHIDIGAAAIVAPVWIAFGVFVGENRALRFQNGGAYKILGGNQFDAIALAV